MPSLVVIGAQWGDEGKGKIVHFLAPKADFVVRYQGGNNAGHTIFLGGKPLVLHLVPVGIAVRGTQCLIGNGVAVNPRALFEEARLLERNGIRVGRRLHVSLGAHIILPCHIERDQALESGPSAVGTTRKGIGPCYEDKAARVGIRASDFIDPPVFKRLLELNLRARHIRNIYVGGPGGSGKKSIPKIRSEILKDYRRFSRWLRPLCGDTSVILDEALRRGEWVIFEGAQGTMLDLDLGTYPFVTSSHPSAGGACIGTGVAPARIDEVLGVVKAYATRVGLGPFPTEMDGPVSHYIREKGAEYGATTGRPRRIGWLDLVQLRYAVRVNGIRRLALTKLDILARIHPLKVCVAYKLNGRLTREFPCSRTAQLDAEPVYETLEGFSHDIKVLPSPLGSGAPEGRVRGKFRLPRAVRQFIARVEKETGVPVSILSLGPFPEDTVVFDKTFRWARSLLKRRTKDRL